MKWRRANSVDPDEVAHDEPPHLDLHCFQIQLHVFSFLMLLVLMMFIYVSFHMLTIFQCHMHGTSQPLTPT